MFQQKNIEEYQNITAPTELKDRVKLSVNKARRRMKHRVMCVTAMAACCTLFLTTGSLLGNSSTILSVNDVVVTQEALPIENSTAFPVAVSMEHSRSLSVYIPMEIEVNAKAKVEVNVGNLIQMSDENQLSVETTSMDISGSVCVYWMLDEMSKKVPTCTISISGLKHQYVVEYDAEAEAYSIRKTK